MNKVEFTNIVKEISGFTKKEAETAVNSVIAAFEDALVNGDGVQIVGFGSFTPTERAARTGRNPQTGELIAIEPCVTPKFKPSKSLKDKMNSQK